MTYSENQGNKELDKDIEEIWLLWKVGEKKSAEKKINNLLSTYPQNTQVLNLAVIIFLDNNEIDIVKSLVESLQLIEGNTDVVKDIKISLSLLEQNWVQAIILLEDQIEKAQNKTKYRQDYAFALMQLKRWKKALDQYEIILRDQKLPKEVMRDYRLAKLNSKDSFKISYMYNHLPDSLREHIRSQKVLKWINDDMNIAFEARQKLFKKNALGDTAAIRTEVYEEILSTDLILNDFNQISMFANISIVSDNDFIGCGIEHQYDSKNFNLTSKYFYNELVTSPLEGINKEATTDTLSTLAGLTLTDNLSIGILLENKFFKLDSKYNQVNDKDDLGNKYLYDAFFNYSVFKKPYISFNMHYKRAHWHKSFSSAETVLDFIGDEIVYYGGVYSEFLLSDWGQVSTNISRSFDEKRDLYSTLSDVNLNVWLRKNLILNMLYGYDFNVDQTAGSGNAQHFNINFNYLF